MKAEMSKHGIITLSPETSLEAYALELWAQRASIKANDLERCENRYWLGSRIVVSTDITKP